MTARKALVRVGGQIVQIPAGDTIEGVGDFKKDGTVKMTGGFNAASYARFDSSTSQIPASVIAAANTIFVQGTSNLGSMANSPAAIERTLWFQASCTLVHNSEYFALLGGANIATQPGDMAQFIALENNAGWRMTGYQRADGTALVSSGGGAGDFKADGTVRMTGGLTLSARVNVTVAQDLNLAALNKTYVRLVISGTPPPVTRFGGSALDGMIRVILMPEGVTLVNSGLLVLPGEADILTRANDVAIAISDGDQAWRVISYLRADGTALVASGGGSGPASTDALPEGATNLYFTNTRARSATRFTWDQSTAMAVWTVPHNTNGFPSVTVVDTLGNVVTPDITYVDANTVQITHGAAYAGKAYIN